MDYIVLIIMGVALRHAIFTHYTLGPMFKTIKTVLQHNNISDNIINKLSELYHCPFCNGYWTGLIIVILNIDFFGFIDGLILFPISVAYISLLIEEHRKLGDAQYERLGYGDENSDKPWI